MSSWGGSFFNNFIWPSAAPENKDWTEEEWKRMGASEGTPKQSNVNSNRTQGGYVYNDPDIVNLQRSVVWNFVKELGTKLLEGKLDLVNVSLPVVLFESRSFLERLADHWNYIPYMLDRAKKSSDPLVRFQCIISMAVAGLHHSIKQEKPFNPILGETYQGIYRTQYGVMNVFCEQTSHHPPISHYLLESEDDSITISGHAGWNASFHGNSLKGHQTGTTTIQFNDDGTVVKYTLPDMWLKGMLWGERVADYLGYMEFTDEGHGLYCKLYFNPDDVGWWQSWIWDSKTPSDTFRGEITRFGNKVSECEGSWLRLIAFDKKTFFDFSNNDHHVYPEPIENPLPSDCRFRIDLISLKEKDYKNAHINKIKLEEKQRRDKALRTGKKYVLLNQEERTKYQLSHISTEIKHS